MSTSLVVGVTKLAWMYGKSRDWAERLLQEWFEEDHTVGRMPPRVFPQGKRRSLFTTMAVVNQYLPPGRDPVLYGRMKDAEDAIADTTRRLDSEIRERVKLGHRVTVLEQRRRAS